MHSSCRCGSAQYVLYMDAVNKLRCPLLYLSNVQTNEINVIAVAVVFSSTAAHSQVRRTEAGFHANVYEKQHRLDLTAPCQRLTTELWRAQNDVQNRLEV